MQVWFAPDEVSVRPGESASLSLVIENAGDSTESYAVIPAGLAAAWTTVTRTNVTLFGGSRDVVEVVVRPPAIHTTTAGPTAVAVRVIPQSAPDDTVVAETIVAVGAFDDRRITMLQPLQRVRRRARFEFLVENHGNGLANCRLHLVDPTGRLDGRFDPPAVGVAPGASTLVQLRARAKGSWLRPTERQLDFEVEAAEPDHLSAFGRATLIQSATLPARLVGRLVAAAAVVAAVIGAWFGVVRPELRDAARRAVDDRVAELEAGRPATPTEPSTPATTIAPDLPPAVIAQEPPVDYTWERLVVQANVGQQRRNSFVVPNGASFRLTDVVLQNPHGDLGMATLSRGDDVIYEWDLGVMSTANEFQPRVSPLELDPGDSIVLAVDCDGSGTSSGTGCEVAVLLTGSLVPVPADE